MAQKRTTPKPTGKADSPDALLARLDHPLADVIEALRATIRKAHPGLEEGVKWNAPSFALGGEDRVTFNLRAKDEVRLIFHCGAKTKPGTKPRGAVADPKELLDWQADDRAIARFSSLAEVKAGATALRKLVAEWLRATCEA